MKIHAMRAAAVGALAAALAVAPAAPAAAYAGQEAPGGAVTAAGVLVASGWSLDFYVNRSVTQDMAAAARKWDKSIDAPSSMLAGVLCRMVESPLAIAMCAGAVAIAGSYPLDRLQEADRIGGCLHLAIGFGLPKVSAYNDAGTYCLGSRS